MYDIIFVGGGVAGCYTASLLPKNLAIMVLEKHKKVRPKDSGIVSGHFHRKLFPLAPGAILQDVRDAFRGKLAHEDLSMYNAAQRAAYLAIILCLVVLVVSGLVIWKPVQFYEIGMLMGDYEGARILHFCAMALMVFIVLVHIVMVILVPRTFPTMISGRARRAT